MIQSAKNHQLSRILWGRCSSRTCRCTASDLPGSLPRCRAASNNCEEKNPAQDKEADRQLAIKPSIFLTRTNIEQTEILHPALIFLAQL